MPVNVQSLLEDICTRIASRVDREKVERARHRHAAVMDGRKTDYLPIVVEAALPELAGMPTFDWNERFHEPDKSLCEQLKTVLVRASADGDAMLSVRPDLGTINCQSVFGVKFAVPEHTRTVVTEYASKEAILEFAVPEDISGQGVMPRMVEHLQHHMAVLRRFGLSDVVSVYHCDQQGPFDIAAMTRGHDIFLDMYEDPDFVHSLMEKCTDVYMKVSRLCKKLNGENDGAGDASGVWMSRGAVRMCGDSDILVSADLYRQFIQPYQAKAFRELGGGWLHYCGGEPGYSKAEGLHLHEAYSEIEGLKGLNWTTAGDWASEIRKLRKLGLVYIGGFHRENGESLDAYYRRLLSALDSRDGLIFGHAWGSGPTLREDEYRIAAEVWRKVQDEIF
jgi:uroporphyrinogen-III decarboxylase